MEYMAIKNDSVIDDLEPFSQLFWRDEKLHLFQNVKPLASFLVNVFDVNKTRSVKIVAYINSEDLDVLYLGKEKRTSIY